MSEQRPKITAAPDGPYIVVGLADLRGVDGPIESKAKMALCRCGDSANKPFCDGAHVAQGFSSARQEDRTPDRVDDYAGSAGTIHDNRGVCSHAGFCTDMAPAVWRLRQEPWIDPDGGTADEVADVVRKCPSGALSHTTEGRDHGDQERDAAVFVARGGPYVVTGGPELVDTAFGSGAPAEHYTLCRCGGSMNKPFCDGTHWNVKFDG